MAKQDVRSAKRAVYKEFIAEHKQSRSPAPHGFKHQQNILWPILSGLVALIVSVLTLFQQNVNSNVISIYSLMACWAVFGMFFFRYKNTSGIIGCIAGSIIGIAVYLVAPLLA